MISCFISLDFGFMFESSPGGNMGFEPDMKLTYDWALLMGSEMDSCTFRYCHNLLKNSNFAPRKLDDYKTGVCVSEY